MRNKNSLDLGHLIAALDASTDFVEVDDCKGNIRFVNRAWSRFLGLDRDDVIGMRWSEALVHADVGAELGTSWDICMAEGTANGEFVIRHSCGIEVNTSYSRTLYRDAEGTTSGMITILRPQSEPAGFVRIYIDERQLAASLSRHPLEVGAKAEFSPNSENRPNIGPVSTTITKRQLDVLRLVALGNSNREIAQELFLEVSTVKTHVHNLLRRLGVTSRFEAIIWAREMNLKQ